MKRDSPRTSRAVYEETGYVMDTHTSVASYGRSYREESKDDRSA